MKDMNNSEKIIKALEGVKKVQPSIELLKKMEDLAINYSMKINSFSKETIIGMAASFLILFAANILAVNQYSSADSNQGQETEIGSYNLVPTQSIYK